MISGLELFSKNFFGELLVRKNQRSRGWVQLFLIFLLSIGTNLARAENSDVKEGWSEDLLARLLSAPETSSASGTTAESDGWVLRSYQLRTLHLGDPGRATNLVSILKRMLPNESKLTEDRGENAVHVFSTVAAQEACLEFISAMDGQETISSLHPEAAIVPEEIKKALADLAASRSDSATLQKIIGDSTRRFEQSVAAAVRDSKSESQSMQSTWWKGLAGLGAALVAALLILGFYLRRAQREEILAATKTASSSLAVVPSQGMEIVMAASRDQQDRTREIQKLMEGFSIAYQADRQRSALMVEAVGRKHGELASTLEQMQHLRREIGENAGKMFLELNREAIDQIVTRAADTLTSRAAEVGLIAESASRKMEETANRLEVQHAKAESLATELERTQKEVDALFDKLKEAQDAARKAQDEAHGQRLIAAQKTAELTRKEAALAGLSLLMQEPVDEIMETLKVAEENTRKTAHPESMRDAGLVLSRDESGEKILRNRSFEILPAPEVPDEDSSCSNPHPYHFHITPVT